MQMESTKSGVNGLHTKTHPPNVSLSQGWLAAPTEYSLASCCLLVLNIYYKQSKQNCLNKECISQYCDTTGIALSVLIIICMNRFQTKLWRKFLRSVHVHPHPHPGGCSNFSFAVSCWLTQHSQLKLGSCIDQLKHQLDPLQIKKKVLIWAWSSHTAHSTNRYSSGCDGRLCWKQDECSGCAAFVVPQSGCFLRKLLWPVCAVYHQRVPNRNVVYLYVAQPLPEWVFVTFRHLCLYPVFTAWPELFTTPAYSALSVNTPQQRTGDQQQTQSLFSSYCLFSWEVMSTVLKDNNQYIS